MLRCGVVCALLCGACYRPTDERACQVACVFGDPDRAVCPGSLTCGENNLCFDDQACAAPVDAAVDDASDAFVLPVCLKTTLSGNYCPIAFHPGTFALRAAPVLDTDSADCDEVAPLRGLMVCVIAADNIAIVGNVAPKGSRPLLLLARDSITVSGTLDLSNGGAGSGGACAATIDGTSGATSALSASGGPGGSQSGVGGKGGAQNGLQPIASNVNTGIDKLRGGCAGGKGGNVGGGAGGGGGGSVELAAGRVIAVDGTIYAYGASGHGAAATAGQTGGGGGGGSGGLILLEAPMLGVGPAGIILAHGGAGGGGALSGTAADGAEANTASGAAAVGGTAVGATSGAGGNGSGNGAAAQAGKNATAANASGGGGGGGPGAIRIYSSALTQMPGSSIHPTPSLNPLPQ